MNSNFQLDKYLSEGVEDIVRSAIKASLKNPKESLFIAKFAKASREAAKIRDRHENEGIHIPPFLICSITDSCNLNCHGCYAKANHARKDLLKKEALPVQEWRRIFDEATHSGISFILLAGGEPLMRQEVLEAAADYKKVMFAVFTNGTLFDKKTYTLFHKKRNLLPILSIEGDTGDTDSRRGEGIYQTARTVMKNLQDLGVFYGVSITVTKKNLLTITDETFHSELYNEGCKVVFFVEYVPVNNRTIDLALSDRERKILDQKLQGFRKQYNDMIFLSFPGDEKDMGGCLAAGRGFFHINTDGSAEPCPFSPYSDTNIRDCSLLEALQSPLFKKLTSSDILTSEHQGGCVLFENEDTVKAINSCSI